MLEQLYFFAVSFWQLVNPQFTAVLILVIASMQFAAYVCIRIFGQRIGMALVGFFGGFVSSTVVFATLPKLYREQPNILRSAIAAAVFSIVGMNIELLAILFFSAPELFFSLLYPVLGMLVTGIIIGVVLMRKSTRDDNELLHLKNPIDFLMVLRLALFISLIMILVTIAKRFVGTEAAQAVAFLGGLFELHSVTLATALIFKAAKLSLHDGELLIVTAIVASYVSKFFLLWTLARNHFAKWTTACLVLMMGVGGLIYYFPNFL